MRLAPAACNHVHTQNSALHAEVYRWVARISVRGALRGGQGKTLRRRCLLITDLRGIFQQAQREVIEPPEPHPPSPSYATNIHLQVSDFLRYTVLLLAFVACGPHRERSFSLTSDFGSKASHVRKLISLIVHLGSLSVTLIAFLRFSHMYMDVWWRIRPGSVASR